MARIRILVVIALAGLVVATPGRAADDPAETACHNKGSERDIAYCLGELTKTWDQRLNRAYQTAQKMGEDATQKSALTRAERAWLAYRTENCGWYGAQSGSIAAVLAADCMLTMTRARATELEGTLPR